MDIYVQIGMKYTKEKISRNLFDCIAEEIAMIDTDASQVDASIDEVINKLKLITERA
tara:strand:+ start:343 stop:513 length:171 start_codon:yes stop_codon:yes gene_type:complete